MDAIWLNDGMLALTCHKPVIVEKMGSEMGTRWLQGVCKLP